MTARAECDLLYVEAEIVERAGDSCDAVAADHIFDFNLHDTLRRL